MNQRYLLIIIPLGLLTLLFLQSNTNTQFASSVGQGYGQDQVVYKSFLDACTGIIDPTGNVVPSSYNTTIAYSQHYGDIVNNFKFSSNNAITYYVRNGIPLALMTIISFLLFFIFQFYIWCMGCCTKCCCNCCTCKPKAKYSTCKKVYPFILFLLMSFGIIGTSIAGLYYQSQISAGMNALRCTLFVTLNDMVNSAADPAQSWQGISTISQQLIQSLESINNGIFVTGQQNFGQQKALNIYQPDFEALNNENLALIQNYQNPTNDFERFIGYLAGTYHYQSTDNIPNVVTQSNTVLNSKSMIMISSAIGLEIGVEQALKPISDQGESFSKAISQAESESENFLNQINKQVTNIQDKMGDQTNTANYMRIGFTTMYSIFLGLAIIGILGAMCQYYKRGCGDFLVKCSWFFYGLIMLLGFLLSTVAYLMSITLMDGCRDFMPVLTNQTLFNEIAFITSPSQQIVNTTLNECLFGSGNIFNALGAEAQVSLMNTFSKTLTNVLNQGNKLDLNNIMTGVGWDANEMSHYAQNSVGSADTSNAENFYNTPLSTCPGTSIKNSLCWLGKNTNSYLQLTQQYAENNINFISNVFSPTSGLIASSNCKFLQSTGLRIMNTTCYMLLNPLWNLTVILIVMSSFMFIASFAACCLHIRHIHIKEMSSTYEVAKGGEVVTKDQELSIMANNQQAFQMQQKAFYQKANNS